MRDEELRELVRESIEGNGMSLREAETKTGVSAATLSRVLRGGEMSASVRRSLLDAVHGVERRAPFRKELKFSAHGHRYKVVIEEIL